MADRSGAYVPHRWLDGSPVEVDQPVLIDTGHRVREGTVSRLSSSAFFVHCDGDPNEYCVVPGHVKTSVCRPALTAPEVTP